MHNSQALQPAGRAMAGYTLTLQTGRESGEKAEASDGAMDVDYDGTPVRSGEVRTFGYFFVSSAEGARTLLGAKDIATRNKDATRGSEDDKLKTTATE